MSRTISPTAKARLPPAADASLGRNGAPAAVPSSRSATPRDVSSCMTLEMRKAPIGIRTKFAISASVTRRTSRKGATICLTVRLNPTASMLDTTNTSTVIGITLLSASTRALRGASRFHICRAFLTGSKILPESLQALRAAEESREDRRVRQKNIAGAVTRRGHPEEHVELAVSLLDKRVRRREIDGLACKNVNGVGVVGRHCVVGQVRMEIERVDILEPTAAIQVQIPGQRGYLPGSLDDRGTQPPAVLYRDAKPF